MIYTKSSLQFQLKSNGRYEIYNQGVLSKKLFGKNNSYSWVKGQGAIYVLLDSSTNDYIYVGECTSANSPLATITGGLNRLYSYGFKGKIHNVEAHFFTFGKVSGFSALYNFPLNKQMKYLIETIEAEIAFYIRMKTGNWPKFQSEIHFHNDLKDDIQIQQEISLIRTALNI